MNMPEQAPPNKPVAGQGTEGGPEGQTAVTPSVEGMQTFNGPEGLRPSTDSGPAPDSMGGD
jgi:hypothetical protein